MRQVEKTRLLIKKIFAITLIFVGILLIGSLFINEKKEIISPLVDDDQKSTNQVLGTTEKKLSAKSENELRELITTEVDNTWKNYSILVKDLNSDFSMGINERAIFTAASVNKVPIAAALYYSYQTEDVDPDDTITISSKDIQDYGTGSIRYDKPGSVYSIKTLGRLMLSQSDNTAAYILSQYTLGLSNIQSRIESWGLVQTDMESNKTSNADIALLFDKIYHEKIVNKALTLELLSYMTHTEFETRLPKNLPEGVTIAHKIGTEIGNIHDVGIVTTNDTAYYIGVFTDDVIDETGTEDLIAQISKLTFDYMSQ